MTPADVALPPPLLELRRQSAHTMPRSRLSQAPHVCTLLSENISFLLLLARVWRRFRCFNVRHKTLCAVIVFNAPRLRSLFLFVRRFVAAAR